MVLYIIFGFNFLKGVFGKEFKRINEKYKYQTLKMAS